VIEHLPSKNEALNVLLKKKKKEILSGALVLRVVGKDFCYR
jgi:hypothetical protein